MGSRCIHNRHRSSAQERMGITLTGGRSIFRPEAVRHRESQSRPGDVLRAAPRWTTWFFYVVIVLVVLALGAASVIEIDRYARGPTTTDERGRVVVLLPVSLAPKVASGNRVEIGAQTAKVVSSGESVLYPSEVKARYSIEVAAPSVAVVTSATGAEPSGIARVLVRSDPVIVQFVPGLDSLLGGDDA